MTFTVYGIPVAQGRPRFFRRGNHVGTYDPEKSKGWKESVRWQAIEHKPEIISGAVELILAFHLPRPQSLPKKVRDHVKKPDLSNCLKAIEDALTGICWRDDSQIVRVIMEKKYGDPPRVEIEIIEVCGGKEL